MSHVVHCLSRTLESDTVFLQTIVIHAIISKVVFTLVSDKMGSSGVTENYTPSCESQI